MSLALFIIVGWTALALAFASGWATRARLHVVPRARRRELISPSIASPRRTRRASRHTVQLRRRTLAVRPSLRIARPAHSPTSSAPARPIA